MIAWILLLLLQPATTHGPRASMVEWTGRETFADALKLLNATGNVVVVDGRVARNQQVTIPTLKLTPGKKPFWVALDELCSQGSLQASLMRDQIELVNQVSKTSDSARKPPA